MSGDSDIEDIENDEFGLSSGEDAQDGDGDENKGVEEQMVSSGSEAEEEPVKNKPEVKEASFGDAVSRILSKRLPTEQVTPLSVCKLVGGH
jgi:hypothetical protein